MIAIYILLLTAIVWLIRRFWPVSYLHTLTINLNDSQRVLPPSVKLLDIRDAAFYDKEHIPGSVNISLGRLPFVWHQSLSPEDEVLILADDSFSSRKAARILHKQRFHKLYAVHGPVQRHLTRNQESLDGGCL